jgi:hypothetical protein
LTQFFSRTLTLGLGQTLKEMNALNLLEYWSAASAWSWLHRQLTADSLKYVWASIFPNPTEIHDLYKDRSCL